MFVSRKKSVENDFRSKKGGGELNQAIVAKVTETHGLEITTVLSCALFFLEDAKA